MEKFKTLLLKIIMVVSLVGVFLFVGIAIFTNQNISYEAYNYIKHGYQTNNFVALSQNVETNIKIDYGKEKDDYASYINSAIYTLNNGINHFLDYLSIEDSLTKGEQDIMRNLFDEYINSFNICSVACKDYKDAYEYAKYIFENNHEQSDYAIANLRARNVYFIEQYINCFEKGSKLFKNVVEVVNNYSFNSLSSFSYSELYYIVQVGTVDYTLENIKADMRIKLGDTQFEKKVRDYDLVDSYYDFYNNHAKFSDANILNTDLREFVDNLNSLKYLYRMFFMKKKMTFSKPK